MDRLPNFLIIGAQKAGTTSLYYYLSQHPQIYMSPVKEPFFFSNYGRASGAPDRPYKDAPIITRLEDYKALFAGVRDEVAWGEASPSYIYDEKAPRLIHEMIPDVKMVAILRHPVDRAYSNYLHALRQGREPIHDFAQAIAAEDERIRQGWGALYHYMHKGFYFQQLNRYLALFERAQLQVFLFEDLMTDPFGMVRSILKFLGVDESFVPDVTEKHNVSGIPRENLLGRMYGWLRQSPATIALVKRLVPYGARDYARTRALDARKLSRELRAELTPRFREDVTCLQDLIGRDLSAWLA